MQNNHTTAAPSHNKTPQDEPAQQASAPQNTRLTEPMMRALRIPLRLTRDYESTLSALESMIKRQSTDSNLKNLEIMNDHIRQLNLDLSKLKVIHVAGTKGKGSTCAFCESILRSHGLRTGLYTSPHLIDVRERIRINGQPISKFQFMDQFWHCWDKLRKDQLSPSMSTYFRFLTVMGFKIFIEEQVDVAIIEVGLGGRLDATNVIPSPVVCGISSLGYDHTNILGHTLAEIAFEKAGIMKPNVPTVTSPQKEEALNVLKKRATEVGCNLMLAPSMQQFEDIMKSTHRVQLGIDGEHQRMNAALAASLCSIWLQKQRPSTPQIAPDELVRSSSNHINHSEGQLHDNHSSFKPFLLSTEFLRGLSTCRWEGRCQTIQLADRNLIFHLDGAHTEESIEFCNQWFTQCVESSRDLQVRELRVLVFNCTEDRNPLTLLAPLVQSRIEFDHVVFTPAKSSKTTIVPPSPTKKSGATTSDVSSDSLNATLTDNIMSSSKEKEPLRWQKHISECWHQLVNSSTTASPHQEQEVHVMNGPPEVLDWLLELSEQQRQLHKSDSRISIRVLVTGSLYLVGDTLRKLQHHL